ncbi:NrdH-redoxin [Candidatus Woesearchaeota archaeon]|nr:NrdH-redoxin [Candidatus Woesearchaeota archaeon]
MMAWQILVLVIIGSIELTGATRVITMEKKIIIYSADNCPWCRKLKDFLLDNSVEFIEKNVNLDHEAANEMITKSGQQGIPVIDIDGKVIVGFNRDAIEQELGL